MRKILAATGAAGLLAASTLTAFGLEFQQAITSVDPAANTVTVASGETLHMPAGYNAASLEVGQQIRFEYDPATMVIETFEVVTDGTVLSPGRDD